LVALGEQMEKATIWEPLDFATADEDTTAAWWKDAVTLSTDYTKIKF
jgi:hypothetical protein